MRQLKNTLNLLLIAAGAAACSHGGGNDTSKPKPPAKVDVLLAQASDFPNSVEVNGTVLSNEMVELHPEVSGRLVYLNIPDGAQVQAGDVLARVNDADLQAQLEQQKAQLELVLKNEQRMKTLLESNGVNQADFDAVQNQRIAAQATVKVLNAQIEKTIIRAPFSGRLGLRLVSVGAYITPQTLLGTLQQTDKLKIDFTLPEAYTGLVHVGSNVTVKTNNSKTVCEARVSAIEPQINAATRNVKVRALSATATVTPGAFAKVIIDLNGHGILIPSNAVIPDALSNQVVVVKDGKALFKEVTLGMRSPDVVEISSGIVPGDSVVVTGVLFVRPHKEVVVRKVKTLQECK